VTTTVVCAGPARCQGRVSFIYKRLKLGSATFDIAANARRVVSIKLTKAMARKLPAKAKVTATIQLAAQS
jgi:hypothetical protein